MTGFFDFDGTQLARSSDPATSHQAAQEIASSLGELQLEAMDAIRRSPDRTVSELADENDLRDPRAYGRRVTELIRRGWIEVSGTRRCEITGRQARTYRVAS